MNRLKVITRKQWSPSSCLVTRQRCVGNRPSTQTSKLVLFEPSSCLLILFPLSMMRNRETPEMQCRQDTEGKTNGCDTGSHTCSEAAPVSSPDSIFRGDRTLQFRGPPTRGKARKSPPPSIRTGETSEDTGGSPTAWCPFQPRGRRLGRPSGCSASGLLPHHSGLKPGTGPPPPAEVRHTRLRAEDAGLLSAATVNMCYCG